ncbi:MAG: translesion error-prone DNA polymerase V autoproteolytic subunit [Chlamydiales bacterium]|nr:translesion error-prone DNA polymerase V autoproteolytic subunit [Chlamydiia bacterium]MCP5505185.1 translesion error-prone DNA polymerase V autoproteolytic subunit [Chlamydiales bacterium]
MNKNLKLTIYKPNKLKRIELPLFSNKVRAGFPSPAEDHIEQKLDLNQFLIKHPAATFFVRVEGDSMKNGGISNGDILIVDRAITPQSGQIIVAILNGEFTVKRVKKQGKRLFLIPENPEFPLMEVTEEVDFQVWGVVTYTIHSCMHS